MKARYDGHRIRTPTTPTRARLMSAGRMRPGIRRDLSRDMVSDVSEKRSLPSTHSARNPEVRIVNCGYPPRADNPYKTPAWTALQYRLVRRASSNRQHIQGKNATE